MTKIPLKIKKNNFLIKFSEGINFAKKKVETLIQFILIKFMVTIPYLGRT